MSVSWSVIYITYRSFTEWTQLFCHLCLGCSHLKSVSPEKRQLIKDHLMHIWLVAQMYFAFFISATFLATLHSKLNGMRLSNSNGAIEEAHFHFTNWRWPFTCWNNFSDCSNLMTNVAITFGAPGTAFYFYCCCCCCNQYNNCSLKHARLSSYAFYCSDLCSSEQQDLYMSL